MSFKTRPPLHQFSLYGVASAKSPRCPCGPLVPPCGHPLPPFCSKLVHLLADWLAAASIIFSCYKHQHHLKVTALIISALVLLLTCACSFIPTTSVSESAHYSFLSIVSSPRELNQGIGPGRSVSVDFSLGLSIQSPVPLTTSPHFNPVYNSFMTSKVLS